MDSYSYCGVYCGKNANYLFFKHIMVFCKYSNIFGEPEKGVHAFRVWDIAVVDVVATMLVAYLISKYFEIPYMVVLILLFASGVFFHRLFCVRTTVDKMLFHK